MKERTKTSNMVKIDADKLYKQIEERGLKLTGLCREFGVNESYFSNAKSRGTLAPVMIALLEARYGILRDKYVIKEVVEEPEIIEVESKESESKLSESKLSEEIEKQLYKIIYSAVYEAVKKAWAE